MIYKGDYDTSTIIYGKFTTYQPSTGAAFTLGGTPALSVYKDDSTTQSTTGVTLTASFDSVTGLNHYAIDTSADGTFYSAGSFFSIVITTGTVDSVSVVGTVVAEFTLRKDSALKPTTAARTLDVSTGGEAGIDWANIGSPTTAQNLSGTNIDTDQVVASVTGAVGSVTGSVGSVVGLTASNLDTTVSSRMATYTQPTGFLAATFPGGTIANTTNITAGTITTVTNLTNLPATAALEATSQTILGQTGTTGVVVAAASKTGYALSTAGVTAIWAEVIAGTTTAVEAMRGFMAAMLGKASGLPTAPIYRDIADTKDVISATTDTSGNRTAVTLDLT